MQDHNVFAGAFVDRFGERRKDPDWLDKAVEERDTALLETETVRLLLSTEQRNSEKRIQELESKQLIRDIGHKGEIFRMTGEGFTAVDELKRVSQQKLP